MSWGVGHGHGSDPTLLWLWCRSAAAAPIRPLAWEPPYAMGEALKKKKKNLKENGYVQLILIILYWNNIIKYFTMWGYFILLFIYPKCYMFVRTVNFFRTRYIFSTYVLLRVNVIVV